ncbi:MAG: hypothetical protein H0V66_01485 [Bdellovibrionales bacterium]|nr:hypothetical protein [Bdellovibrionales bacterium]
MITLLVGTYLYIVDFPYYKYSHWINGTTRDRYFEIKNFRDIYLNPTGLEAIPSYQEDYVQLWKEFPLRNSLVPMPTRHPMFQTVPIIEMQGKSGTPLFGIILQDPSGREISRVYTLPNKLYQDHSQGQELFKLPYVRNRILNKGLDEVWKDIFSYKIEVKDKPVDEMIYDLYIVHLRSKMLPKETVRYGLIKGGKQALIELVSNDKDYSVELIMTMDSGSIFSYILKTEKNRAESVKLRAKFLASVTFSPVDEAISKFLYTEFKQLNYARQVDQEGMLYLFAAWSQNPENVELLKEMIYYLERGQNTKKQLKTLYTYSFKRYKKTYTTRKDVDEQDNPEIILQRKIEIEEIENKKSAEAATIKGAEAPELTPDEKMNIYLKKAKREKTKETEDMIVH